MKAFSTLCQEVGYVLTEEVNKRVKSKTGTYKLESFKPNKEAIIVGQNEGYNARIIIRLNFSEWEIIVEVKDKQGYKVIRNEVKDVLIDSVTWSKVKKYKQFLTKWKKEIGHFIQPPPEDFMQEVFIKVHDSNGARLFRESESNTHTLTNITETDMKSFAQIKEEVGLMSEAVGGKLRPVEYDLIDANADREPGSHGVNKDGKEFKDITILFADKHTLRFFQKKGSDIEISEYSKMSNASTHMTIYKNELKFIK